MTERKEVPLFSLREAAERGVLRVRQPNWACELDHIKLDIIDGAPGPWVHMYSPMNIAINGRDPVDLLWALLGADPNAKSFYAYVGPLPESDEYHAAVERFGTQPL